MSNCEQCNKEPISYYTGRFAGGPPQGLCHNCYMIPRRRQMAQEEAAKPDPDKKYENLPDA